MLGYGPHVCALNLKLMDRVKGVVVFGEDEIDKGEEEWWEVGGCLHRSFSKSREALGMRGVGV